MPFCAGYSSYHDIIMAVRDSCMHVLRISSFYILYIFVQIQRIHFCVDFRFYICTCTSVYVFVVIIRVSKTLVRYLDEYRTL